MGVYFIFLHPSQPVNASVGEVITHLWDRVVPTFICVRYPCLVPSCTRQATHTVYCKVTTLLKYKIWKSQSPTSNISIIELSASPVLHQWILTLGWLGFPNPVLLSVLNSINLRIGRNKVLFLYPRFIWRLQSYKSRAWYCVTKPWNLVHHKKYIHV